MAQQRTLSTPELIEAAYRDGTIDAAKRLTYLAYAIYEYDSLPAEYRSTKGWHGTSVVRELYESTRAATLGPAAAEVNRLLGGGGTLCDQPDAANDMESANFRINYGTIGGGLTISEYVTSLEATYLTQVSALGWAAPPLCSAAACDSANPFGKYPVQIADLGGSLYGYVNPGGGQYTGTVGDNPSTTAIETESIASCMVLNGEMDLLGPPGAQGNLDATTSHEFVHAIQFGYGDPVEEDAMWYESTASYMEDEVFDAANTTYSYLWPTPSNCLGEWPAGTDPNGVSEYSNFLMFRHIAEHNGGTNEIGGGEEIVQRMWERIAAGQSGLDAYDAALADEGTTSTNLNDAFHTYAVALRFSKACGTLYPEPYCFEEGAEYVAAKGGTLPAVQGTIDSSPGSSSGSIANHYSINFVELPVGGSYQVSLQNTATGGEIRGSLACDTGTTFTIMPFPAIADAGVTTTIPSFDGSGCMTLTAVLTNQEKTESNPTSCASHSYTVSVADEVVAVDSDGDGLADFDDNCPLTANPDQADEDGDGTGDLCEPDTDGDGVIDDVDNCDAVINPDQTDTDGDGTGDVCEVDTDGDGVTDDNDNCPMNANADQADADGDGTGDACEADGDGDGVDDSVDNCPVDANADQADVDGDGEGDACDTGIGSHLFSTETDQFVLGLGNLLHHNVYSLASDPAVVEEAYPGFLAPFTGLDALSLGADGLIYFSVGRRGGVTTPSGLMVLEDDVPYRYFPRSGLIAPVPGWNLDLGSLDALAVTDDGLAFSTSSVRFVAHPGGSTTVRPQNAYRLDLTTGVVELLFDGQALGLLELDALSVVGDRVVFSTAGDRFIPSSRIVARQQNAYVYDPVDGSVTMAVDAGAAGIRSLDAVHTDSLPAPAVAAPWARPRPFAARYSTVDNDQFGSEGDD